MVGLGDLAGPCRQLKPHPLAVHVVRPDLVDINLKSPMPGHAGAIVACDRLFRREGLRMHRLPTLFCLSQGPSGGVEGLRRQHMHVLRALLH